MKDSKEIYNTLTFKKYPTQIIFSSKWPELNRNDLVIYDKKLLKISSSFTKWIKNFSLTYPVKAGEELKEIKNIYPHILNIFKLFEKSLEKKIGIVSVGGGTVGDFSGWIASNFKRGVPLTHIPTTWLSAIDSSHGGKNGLNINGIKNQLGTIFPASQVYLIRDILIHQNNERVDEAFSELIKIGLLNGGRWLDRLLNSTQMDNELFWKLLPEAISAKYQIVLKDPYETLGIRQQLNLGHTLGHVIEAYSGISHGRAVASGIDFALNWSQKRGLIEFQNWKFFETHLLNKKIWKDRVPQKSKMKILKVKKLVCADKKRGTLDTLMFVFLKKRGVPHIEKIKISDFLQEIKRQEWA